MSTKLALSLIGLFLSASVAAADYAPKFARIHQPSAVLSVDLCPTPTYPKASMRNEETGVTTLRFTISPTGSLLATDVARSSGFPNLDQAALEAISKCQFKPGSINGVPVQTISFTQYVWTLE